MRPEAGAILQDYERWLYMTASRIAGPHSPDLEDLVQEGRVAMWLAYESSYDPAKGSLPSWLTSSARNRMLSLVRGDRWTGEPPRFHSRVAKPDTLSLDCPVTAAENGAITVGDTIPAPDALDGAELACHHREIAAAVARLTPAQRRYVTARFWLEMSGREMTEGGVFGYDPSALWNSARNGARRKLAADLAHLGSVVA